MTQQKRVTKRTSSNILLAIQITKMPKNEYFFLPIVPWYLHSFSMRTYYVQGIVGATEMNSS